uniref:FHA domain-containing protein n=1 Tax=Trypanosoma vivax (strain Y486) TaxID=1055687 RepID=G0TYW2_TRYVY|nr:conserved hypothetical protein [Trypanosoma vivax Y486]
MQNTVEHLCAALVLMRGPLSLQRRILLRLPLDGTHVTVGRAADCDVVLESNLLFASQRHCRLFATRNTSGAGEVDLYRSECPQEERGAPRKRVRESGATGKEGDDNQAICYTVLMEDVGSRNGTFVNGVRIGANVPTVLHHGDTVVLGGMRDIQVGESLPSVEAVPEVVIWGVALCDVDSADFGYEVTPHVFLSADYIVAMEMRQRLEQPLENTGALNWSFSPPCDAATAPLFDMAPPSPPPKKELYEEMESNVQCNNSPIIAADPPLQFANNNESDDGSTCVAVAEDTTRRSGTVAAHIDFQESTAEVFGLNSYCGSLTKRETIECNSDNTFSVEIRAVRINSITLTEETYMHGLCAYTKRSQERRDNQQDEKNKRRESTTSMHPRLRLTTQHIQWQETKNFNNRATEKQAQMVNKAILWSCVRKIVYNAQHNAITVILQPATNDNGKAGHNNFVTWQIGHIHARRGSSRAISNKEHEQFQKTIRKIKNICVHQHKITVEPIEIENYTQQYAPHTTQQTRNIQQQKIENKDKHDSAHNESKNKQQKRKHKTMQRKQEKKKEKEEMPPPRGGGVGWAVPCRGTEPY